jgi:dTMP kinase
VCHLARSRGAAVLLTREPGGTPAGERIREVVLHSAMSAESEALLMFAARADHVAGKIRPALEAGQWVVCDRFSDATYAYQCGGRGLKRDFVVSLERLVHPGLQPDATFLFDLDPATAYARQRLQGRTPDRFESEQADFFTRVREAYLERAREHSRRFHVVDASGKQQEVRDRLEVAFAQAFA